MKVFIPQIGNKLILTEPWTWVDFNAIGTKTKWTIEFPVGTIIEIFSMAFYKLQSNPDVISFYVYQGKNEGLSLQSSVANFNTMKCELFSLYKLSEKRKLNLKEKIII